MHIGRRAALKLLGLTGLTLPALPLFARRAAGGLVTTAVGLRPLTAADAAALQAIMTSCVSDAEAFFGKCGEWPLSWAQEFITHCPASPLLTWNGMPAAFFELPPIAPAPARLPADASSAAAERFALRERNRTTFRVRAAGVRFDLLAPDEAVALFRTLLYEAFRAAQSMGYTAVEAWAPWERHPMMARKWTDYPGCELTQPVARNQESGHDIYCLRWQLDQAVAALAAEARYHVA